MIIKRIPAGVYAANCYILIDEDSNECAVIDPGGDGEELVELINSLGIKPKFILLTHGHMDHTGAVGNIQEEFNVPAHIHKKDWDFINNGEFMFGPLRYKGKTVSINDNIVEGKTFEFGKYNINCIETPGHTPGGACFIVDEKLFTGDTLFMRSVGRTDLSGGSFTTLIQSIKEKLLVLNEAVTVYPGHGPQTTIKYERENNPFI
jgi:glyoxylase-like metal-dependent hydrolase (beta-lactamase superfamily II)